MHLSQNKLNTFWVWTLVCLTSLTFKNSLKESLHLTTCLVSFFSQMQSLGMQHSYLVTRTITMTHNIHLSIKKTKALENVSLGKQI